MSREEKKCGPSPNKTKDNIPPFLMSALPSFLAGKDYFDIRALDGRSNGRRWDIDDSEDAKTIGYRFRATFGDLSLEKMARWSL
ncbi:hypothetical protein JTE90_023062 [Oedothorax gibbosus]|uniref:Uncharacterized protein n=1 Tax=Oedothorax gibbosus TaxID=931172 RepID=A0AAV6UY05_9ARAC|nr:hypothetical protein JTE90_023062 [Oedothorax gibbosus]